MEQTAEPRDACTCCARDRLVAAALGLLAFLLVLATQRSFGMCWDEGYYYPTYRDVASWIGELFRHPLQALSGEGIRAGWERINELPPVTKWLGALLVLVTPAGGELFVVRLFPAALFGATASLLYAIARRRAPVGWAALAAGAYLLHPRLFGHAHFAASETPFAFLTALAIFVATGDLRRWSRRLLLAAVAGLALATKANGLILLAALGAWLLLRPWFSPRGEDTPTWRDDAIALACVVLLAPLVAWAVWPWMWDETAARLREYLAFVTRHEHYGVWYLGEKWVLPPGSQRPVPWHYPLVITLVASPVLFLALVGAGLAKVVQAATHARGRVHPEDLLLLLLAAGPLAAAMLPNAPKYDGLRLFLPAFVPLALLAGRAGEWFPVEGSKASGWRPPAVVGVLLLATAVPSLTAGLGYYNLPTRLIARSGVDFPFETTYWGESITPEVMQEVREILGPGEVRLKLLALHGAVLVLQSEWGRLPAEVDFPAEPPFDGHLLQNRKGFWGPTEWWFVVNREPLAVWPEGSDDPKLYLFDGRPPGVP